MWDGLLSNASSTRILGNRSASSPLPPSSHPYFITCALHCNTRFRTNMAQGGSPLEDGRSVKRRKVRKGTQSCWECKRRKVRCTYAVVGNTTCDNCLRRNTKCTSQDCFDEQGSPASSDGAGIEARLRRVEDVLQQIVKDTDPFRLNRKDRSDWGVPAALEQQLQSENIEVHDTLL
jgi:hypothetical protein